MKIVYNPKDGAPIVGFIAEGTKLPAHFPDGYVYDTQTGSKKANGLMQYPDTIADEILDRYGFLQLMTVEQAKEILNRPPDPQFECDHPGCEFKTTHKVALSGHKKSHAKDTKDTESVDDSLQIPIATGEPVGPLAKSAQMRDNDETDAEIQNGPDKDGVDWYGEGAVVQNQSQVFGGVRPDGKGHFVG